MDKADSSIIVKLPLSRLKYLKHDFEDSEDGLRLENFLKVIVEHANLDGDILEELIPSVIDYFRDVDVNGDGQMDWQEFTQSIIAGIEKIPIVHNDRFKIAADVMIQKPSSHTFSSCVKVIESKRIVFVCVGDELILYGVNEQSSTLLTPPAKRLKLMELSASDRYPVLADMSTTVAPVKGGIVQNSPAVPTALNIAFIDSLGILCILRSDSCIEFFIMIARTANSHSAASDYVERVNVINFGASFTSLAIKDVPKQDTVLFAAGLDHHIYSWTLKYSKLKGVELTNGRLLSKHADYVMEVAVISTDIYRYVVSCSMDKTMMVWESESFNHKITRHHRSGLQALSFDGKSLVYAAGCDGSIVAWDLDSQFDAPIFILEGRTTGAVRLIGMHQIDCLLSLDADGVLCCWDVNKDVPLESDERLVDSMEISLADKMTALDCFQHVSTRYKGLAIVGAGKQQHNIVLKDATPSESPPITALFSPELVMVITVHTRNLIQWNVLTGKQLRVLEYDPTKICAPPSNLSGHAHEAAAYKQFANGIELTCAVVADRNRKFITGDSGGNIVLFSFLTLQKLRQFAQFPYAIKHLVFSGDKNVICVGNPGHLHVLDSSLNLSSDNSNEFRLRDVRAHTCDVIAIAFSRPLNLIATADSEGIVKVWSYSSLLIESIIDFNGVVSNGDISHLAFLDPYPLLLVPDVEGNFIVLAVGYAALKFGKRLWKIQTTCTMQSALLGSRSPPGVGSPAPGSPILTRNSGLHASFARRTGLDRGLDKGLQSMLIDFNNKARHLEGKRSVTSILIRMEPLHDAKKARSNNKQGIESKRPFQEDDEQTTETSASDHDASTTASQSMMESQLMDPAFTDENRRSSLATSVPASLCPFVHDRNIMVYCGFDDGSMAITDITDAMKDINIRALSENEFTYMRPTFNAKRRLQRKINEELNLRMLWTPADIERVFRCTSHPATLLHCWEAHKAAVVAVRIIGDKQLVLSASNDQWVQLWSRQGQLQGILTRGRQLDSILSRKWLSPIDIEARAARRRKEAVDFIMKLDLKPLTKKLYLDRQFEKWPELFPSKKRFEESVSECSTSSSEEDMKETREESMQETLRRSLLEQLQGDSKVLDENTIVGAPMDADDDLTSIHSDDSHYTRQDARYLESVTIDPTALMKPVKGQMSPESKTSNSQNLGIAETLERSSAALREFEDQKRKMKMKRDAEMQAQQRQKSLYPHLFSESRRAELGSYKLLLEEKGIKPKQNSFSKSLGLEDEFGHENTKPLEARLPPKPAAVVHRKTQSRQEYCSKRVSGSRSEPREKVTDDRKSSITLALEDFSNRITAIENHSPYERSGEIPRAKSVDHAEGTSQYLAFSTWSPKVNTLLGMSKSEVHGSRRLSKSSDAKSSRSISPQADDLSHTLIMRASTTNALPTIPHVGESGSARPTTAPLYTNVK